MPGPLVSTDWLAGHLDSSELRVADVRWYLDPARKGREEFRTGHIPGSVFLDVHDDLSAPGGVRGGPIGRHPWPSPGQIERVMGRAGISSRTFVVAYDDAGGATAARLWYVLRAHGHDAVAVLDGGIPKWVAEGRPLEIEERRPEPVQWEARLRPGWVVSKADLIEAPPPLVLDARAPERYRGDTEPIDTRPGRLPGAKNAPYADNMTADPVPVLRPAHELRRRYEALGAAVHEPVVYCGSGVTACHDLLALEVAGLKGRLYAGSYSEWSADPSLPVEKG